MSISAESVKALREKTGVGMMDCKKALEHAQGNFEEAIKYLREKGMSAATKKSDRSTNEGRIFIALAADKTTGGILELNCETDFVSSNDAFIGLGDTIVQHILTQRGTSLEALQNSTISGQPFSTYLSEAVLKLGENITVKQFQLIESAASLSSYVHMNGKIGVLVEFSAILDQEIGRDIAMHVAATSPQYVKKEEVPEAEVEKEKDIIRNQSLNEGKPAAILDKVVAGKIGKYFKDICLIEQEFIKNSDQTVQQVLAGKANVVRFVRYSLGG